MRQRVGCGTKSGVAAELSGAAAVAALLSGRYRPVANERICAIVYGAGTDGIG
jgi:threonine dehydratase